MEKLYVAYGSNLNMRQMKNRCPTARFVGTGIIRNYELQFKGTPYGAHATIAPTPGQSVPVGIWTIRKEDENRLDLYEGYHKTGYRYYDKAQIAVEMDSGGSLMGMVYIMDPKMDFGKPTAGYVHTVRQGYRDCGLDTAVLEQALDKSLELAQQRIAHSDMRLL